jgi:enoyl-CoA hydratase/carnithine racemase
MAADMCFAAAGRTWLSLYEVRAGAIPGGGGTQVRAIKGAVDAGLGVDLKAGLEQEGRFVGLVNPPPAEVVDRAGRSRKER